MTSPLAERFARADEFGSSPLYRALCPVVASEPELLDLAGRARAGQQPTYLFFAAVHALLLAGAHHPLAAYYPSVVGAAARDPDGAGPALVSFCRAHADEVGDLVSRRLVQTNAVRRSLALRLGLVAVAGDLGPGVPVHLVEVGASAGAHLRSDRYGYRLGGRRFGDPASPVQVTASWRSDEPVPDLDAVPPFARVVGIDLAPPDPTDPDDRRWLEALVWPENGHELALLRRALGVLADDPPEVLAGDAADLCPRVADGLPPGEPRVLFHAATRMHVATGARPAFDAALRTLGDTGPLWTIAMDGDLVLRRPDGETVPLAASDNRLEWVAPPGR